MRLIVCGDRDWNDYKGIRQYLALLLAEGIDIECVIEGGCRGADQLAKTAATELGITVSEFLPKWETHGKAAGPIRNRQMLTVGMATNVVAFHNDLEHSKGTLDMVTQAQKAGIPVIVIGGNYDGETNAA
jgi:hypothetical protein